MLDDSLLMFVNNIRSGSNNVFEYDFDKQWPEYAEYYNYDDDTPMLNADGWVVYGENCNVTCGTYGWVRLAISSWSDANKKFSWLYISRPDIIVSDLGTCVVTIRLYGNEYWGEGYVNEGQVCVVIGNIHYDITSKLVNDDEVTIDILHACGGVGFGLYIDIPKDTVDGMRIELKHLKISVK